MDRLTREAIDERLRVLESVSQTVYGCVDELMRLRSALPVRATLPPQAQEGDANQAAGSGSTGSRGRIIVAFEFAHPTSVRSPHGWVLGRLTKGGCRPDRRSCTISRDLLY